MNKTNHIYGYIISIIGSACYGLNPLFALPLYATDVDPMSVLFYRYAFSLVLMAAWMFIRHESFRVTWREFMLTMVMGVMFAGSSACLFFSFKYMDAGLASVILFTYPLFVALFSWLLFRERLTAVTAMSIVVAFAGILMLKGDGTSQVEGGSQYLGMLLALGAGLSYAFYLIGVNRSVLKSMNTARLSFYALLSGTILFLISTRLGADITLLPDGYAWFNALGLSLFPTIISMVLVTRAIHIIGSTPASIIGALEPLTALLVSVAVFGGIITPLNILGIILILGAVVLMVSKKV